MCDNVKQYGLTGEYDHAPTPGASPTHVSAWTGRKEQRCGRQCVSQPKARDSAKGETRTR